MSSDPISTPRVKPRLVACPKCRQRFETLRRWRMACTECGHEWEETSVLSWQEKLSYYVSESWGYIFVGLAWASVIGFGLFILAMLGFAVVTVTEQGGLAAGILLGVLMTVVLLAAAVLLRPSREAAARIQLWMVPWQGPRKR